MPQVGTLDDPPIIETHMAEVVEYMRLRLVRKRT